MELQRKPYANRPTVAARGRYRLPVALLLLLNLVTGFAFGNPNLTETREILFEDTELAEKAAELGTPAAIYEWVRNTHEYAPYHGSRSNSLNTFGGRRGSDVDIASVLIAMFRSQGLPARYAVGVVQVKVEELANWLGVRNDALAVAILQDQGIQAVSWSPGDEHVAF